MNHKADSIKPVLKFPSSMQRGDHPDCDAEEAAKVIATGWFAMLEARYPDTVEVHPGVGQLVLDTLDGRTPVVSRGPQVIRAHIALLAGSLSEDPVAASLIRDLEDRALAGSVIGLSIYHDDMRTEITAPDLRPVRGDDRQG
ncbi:hypothetical protein GCM10027298_23160 [Epidermidibacterium keratini]